MNRQKEIQHLIEVFQGRLQPNWKVKQNEHNGLEIIHTMNSDQGLKVSLDDFFTKLDAEPKRQNELTDDLWLRIKATLKASDREHKLLGQEQRIFPVLRHPSFPKQAKDGKSLVTREHTPESIIYYALDLGTSYILIHSDHVEEAGWTEEKLHELAIQNISRLDSTPKVDRVGENEFYFISRGDGYSASRILNPKLIDWMSRKATGALGIAIPHQDVLIFADLRDQRGYQVLAQIAMDFAVKGDIPISSVAFLWEKGELVSYMPIRTGGGSSRIQNPIMGKKKK